MTWTCCIHSLMFQENIKLCFNLCPKTRLFIVIFTGVFLANLVGLLKNVLCTYTCGGVYCDWTWNESLAIIQTNEHIDWSVERGKVCYYMI